MNLGIYRKVTFLLLSILIISLFFSACAPIYVPNQVNVPLLKNQNDMNISGAVGSSGTDFQLAYSPFNNLGIMANGSFGSGEDEHRHTFGEFGAGYYQTMGLVGVFDFYAGAGFGQSETEESGEFQKDDYMRFFIQPSFGISVGFFEAALSARTCYVNFPDYGSGLFFEPVVTARLGFPGFKFTTQVGYSFNFDAYSNFGYLPFIVNMGVMLEIR